MLQSWKPWKHSTGPRTEEGKKVSARNSIKHGLRSAEFRGLWKGLNALDRERRQLFESDNFEKFSESPDERTNQQLLEILKHGESITVESPPVHKPDGSVFTVSTTVTRPASRWLIEGILDGKL